VKRLVAALFVVAGLCGSALAQNLSARAFTEEYAKATRDAVPSATVTVTKDLEFTIRFPDGQTTRTSIAQAYQSYKEDPKRIKSLIGAHILRLTDSRPSASTAQEKLSPRAFTEKIAEALRKALPSVKVSVGRELEIELQYSDGQNVTAELKTAYEIYTMEPNRLQSVIDRHIERLATSEWAKTQVKLNHSKIVPVVKNRRWLAETEREIKKAGVDQEPLVEDFVDDLVIAYAEDTPKIFRYIARHEYKDRWENLRSLAIRNLSRVAPKVQLRGMNEHVTIVSAGDDYTSSLLAVDPFWASPERFKVVKGDVVVAIPTRDVILVTGSANGTIKNFRALVADIHDKGPHPVSQTLLVFRNKRFAKFTGN
jgi:uncharacterized protein YtpQ (UPF0354 family)